jgi:site-specific recombinase XerD
VEASVAGEPCRTERAPAAGRRARYANGRPLRRAGERRQTDEAFEMLLERFVEHLTEVEYRSLATVNTYAKWARNYYRWLAADYPGLPIDRASPEIIHKFLAFKRAHQLRSSTLATVLHSLRSFYQFILPGDPAQPNPTLGIRPPKVIAPPVDPYSEQEVRTLLAIAKRHEHSADRRRWVGYVALTVLAGTGIRNGELLSLRTADVDVARHQLSVVGKGSKPRIVPFGPATAKVLTTYLAELRPHLPPSPYFIVNPRSLRQGPYWGQLEPNTLAGLVRDLLAETGIPGRHFPHRFRHTFATNALRAVGNIEVVRELLGHADIKTTSRYLHATMADKHQAADRIDFAAVPDPARPSLEVGSQAQPQPEPAPGSGLSSPPPRPASAELAGPPPAAALPTRAAAILAEAVATAQRLPTKTLSRLTSLRLAEAAIGALTAPAADTDVLVAAAALILARAHQLPVPLTPLLEAHGAAALRALEQARSTLELLARCETVPG